MNSKVRTIKATFRGLAFTFQYFDEQKLKQRENNISIEILDKSNEEIGRIEMSAPLPGDKSSEKYIKRDLSFKATRINGKEAIVRENPDKTTKEVYFDIKDSPLYVRCYLSSSKSMKMFLC